MPTYTDQQVEALKEAFATIQSIVLGPGPVAVNPLSLNAAAAQYVADHFAVTEDQFNQAASLSDGTFQSAAIVRRFSGVMTPSQGAPVYGGVPLGQAFFDVANSQDTDTNPVAFKGTSDLTAIRKALATGNVGPQFIAGPLEVWIWLKDGTIVFAKDGSKVGPEVVFVTGMGSVQVPGQQ